MNDYKKINVDWISDHQDVKNNEQTDQIIKKTVVRSTVTSNEKVFFVHVKKIQTKIRKTHKQDWLNNALKNKVSEHKHRYKLQNDWRQDSVLITAFKKLINHYIQLKSDHIIIKAHFAHIKAWNNNTCTHYETINESVYHVLLKCRKWQTQWNILYKVLVKTEISQIFITEKLSKNKLLKDFKIIKILFQFLTNIIIECFENENMRILFRIRLDNKHDLKKLKIKKHKEKN